jgi:hypothetical protein
VTRGPAASRANALAPWAAAFATLAVLALTREGPMPVGVFYDDGIYVDLAKSLLAGSGYHHLALPGAPAGIHYPPLYPAWLALWSWLRPPVEAIGLIAWLKIGNAFLAAASVVPWGRWGARRFGIGWLASVAAALAVLLVPARAVTGTLFSEPLSWLLLGLTFDLADEPDDAAPPSRARAIAAAVVASLLPLARTILLPVTLAAAWRMGTEPGKPVAVRQREAMLAAFMLIPALAWIAWTRQHAHDIPAAWTGSYGSYGGMWRESVNGVGELFDLMWHQLSGLLRVGRQVWGLPGMILALIATGAGLWRVRGWRSAALLGTLGYLAVVLIWPISPDRFLWGILPLLMILMVGGACAIAELVPASALERLPRSAIAVVILLLPVATCARLNVRGYAADGWVVPQRHQAMAYGPVVTWAATLPRDAVILTADDPLVAQATGLEAAPLLSPDLRETRGASALHSAAERVTASACAAGAGWMVVTDTLDEAAVAISAVRATAGSPVRFENEVHLDGARLAVQFHCER